MKVSIALATFNGERFLPELLQSLANQKRLPFELVVGDDGSSDATLPILREFAAQAPFAVALTRNDCRLGYADSFLATATRCSGDIVAFCDQDDIWHPDKLELVERTFLTAPNAVLSCHYATVVDASGQRVGRRFPRELLEPVYAPPTLPLVQFPGFSLSVRACILKAADANRRPSGSHAHVGRLSHDAWLWLLAACIGDVVVLPDELVSYRQHDNIFGDLHVGLMEKVRRLVAANATTYDYQSAHAAELAGYLRRLADDWSADDHPAWAANALELAGRHQDVANHASKRADVYNARTRRSSVQRWLAMHRSKEAWRSEGNRSALSPLKDLIAAVARTGATRP